MVQERCCSEGERDTTANTYPEWHYNALGLTNTPRDRPASLLRAAGTFLLSLTAAKRSLCYKVREAAVGSSAVPSQAGCYLITNSLEGVDMVPTDPGNQSPLNPYITFDGSGDY